LKKENRRTPCSSIETEKWAGRKKRTREKGRWSWKEEENKYQGEKISEWNQEKKRLYRKSLQGRSKKDSLTEERSALRKKGLERISQKENQKKGDWQGAHQQKIPHRRGKSPRPQLYSLKEGEGIRRKEQRSKPENPE